MPEISILLPTYNGAQFLEQQLDSILEQSFSDFECLMVDDGSSDDSIAILDRYAEEDARMRRLPSDGNKGQKARLKELLAASNTPMIAISDQDDIWGPEKLQHLHDRIDDCSLVFGPSHLIDGSGKSLGKTLMQALNVEHHPDDRLSILRSSRVSAHAMLCRREAIAPELFDSRLPFDWLISLIAAFSDGAVFEPAADTYHRLHGGNAHNGGVLKMLKPWKITASDVRKRFDRFKAKRSDFIEQLEQLSAFAMLDASIRTSFAEAAGVCKTQWQSGSGGAKNGSAGETFRQLRSIFKPMAGSERDWRHFEEHLWPMCLGLPRQVSYVLSAPA